VWNRLTQSVTDAPSDQSFEAKIYKLWENYPIKTDYTAHASKHKLRE